MKQLNLLGILLLSFTACKKEKTQADPAATSQADPIATYHTFTGELAQNGNSTCPSADGNFLICATIGSDLSILKTTKSGTQIWQKNFYTGTQSNASSITQLNGEIFVCGTTSRNYGSKRFDVLLVKATSSGDTLWTKTYGSNRDDSGTSIIATSDGNILIAGTTYGFGASNTPYSDVYLIKVDPDGNILWETGYTDIHEEIAFNLIETQNGEYLVTGTNRDDNSSTYGEIYLLKVSASGLQIWNKSIGEYGKWGFSTIETTSGDLVICGVKFILTQQIVAVKTDHLGNVIWEQEYGSTKHLVYERGYAVKQNPDGSFTICGSVYNEKLKILLLKIDENGNQIWMKAFNDQYDGEALNLFKDGDDNILTGNRNDGIFLTRTDGNGNYK